MIYSASLFTGLEFGNTSFAEDLITELMRLISKQFPEYNQEIIIYAPNALSTMRVKPFLFGEKFEDMQELTRYNLLSHLGILLCGLTTITLYLQIVIREKKLKHIIELLVYITSFLLITYQILPYYIKNIFKINIDYFAFPLTIIYYFTMPILLFYLYFKSKKISSLLTHKFKV